MPSADVQSKSGMTLVEVMISVSLFSLLGAAVWMNVSLQQQSFRYNRISNANTVQASFVVNQLAYGNDTFWGLRSASRSQTSVLPTGLSGSSGATGWIATVRHNMDTTGLPSPLDTEVQLITFNPVQRTVDVDGVVVGENVENAYFTLTNGDILLGVLVVEENNGLESILETRITMRNP